MNIIDEGSLKQWVFWVKGMYSSPNDKIIASSKLEAFAGDKIDAVKMMISLLDRVENSVGKGENAGN